MRTIGLILYFLLTSFGFNTESEQVTDVCTNPTEQESSEAIVDHSESFFSKLSRKLSKNNSKKNQNRAFDTFMRSDKDPHKNMLTTHLITDLDQQSPMVNPSILKHTFFNILFFPPDSKEAESHSAIA
jgi:hypothetical protein